MFWLIQAPNISKHISRNGGATIKASRKTAHAKNKLFWGKKAIFPPKMVAPSKKGYSPKYVYWYQCFNVWKMVGVKSSAQRFRHSIDSHCLCMWVKKENLCIGDWKVFRFYLKECSLSRQLNVSFNFGLDHQFKTQTNWFSIIIDDQSILLVQCMIVTPTGCNIDYVYENKVQYHLLLTKQVQSHRQNNWSWKNTNSTTENMF